MSKHSLKLLMAAFVLLAGSGVVQAESGLTVQYVEPSHQDVVRDSNGNVVRSSSGECVRTQWAATGGDPCAEAAPAPQKVVTPIPDDNRTIYFPFNKATLTPESKQKLDALAAEIKAHGKVRGARIVGYADRFGTATYNERLSKQRADTVRQYLTKKGVINAKLAETRWFGDTMPATNCPKELVREHKIRCMQLDRRVEVEIEYADAPAATK